MYRKGAQDKKRAKVFGKLGRELQVAAKEGGGDPDSNPRLRAAIVAARNANMPKDNIERAIKKGTGESDSGDFESIRYEGFGPGGVALIVEVLTDNRNRTASEVRTAFSKNGGNMADTGAVSFMFDRIGEIRYPAGAASDEVMFEAALDAGAEDVASSKDGHEIACAADDLHAVAGALTEQFGDPDSAKLVWRPQSSVPVSESDAQTLFSLLDTLDDNDDVQTVSANFDIADEMMERLTA
jgi:YebC/PmpR family DNA-binding regulatory protein